MQQKLTEGKGGLQFACVVPPSMHKLVGHLVHTGYAKNANQFPKGLIALEIDGTVLAVELLDIFIQQQRQSCHIKSDRISAHSGWSTTKICLSLRKMAKFPSGSTEAK